MIRTSAPGTIDDHSRATSQQAFLRNVRRGEAYQSEAPGLWDVTFQTAVGFLLTVVTIQGVPLVQQAAGWPVAVALLGLGPLLGAVAMLRLQPLLTPGA